MLLHGISQAEEAWYEESKFRLVDVCLAVVHSTELRTNAVAGEAAV
jgi:hypothetical protein